MLSRKSSKSLYFDGVSGYLNGGLATTLTFGDTDSFTDSVWVKSEKVNNQVTYCSKGEVTYFSFFVFSSKLYVRAFANGTEEFMQGSFTVPADLGAGASNVTFEVQGWAKTVDGTNNLVEFTLGHRAIANSEAINGTYTDVDSGDKTTDGTQNDLDIFTWTQTITNTGWAAGDVIHYRFSRIAPSATELVGDYYVWRFIIKIPRA